MCKFVIFSSGRCWTCVDVVVVTHSTLNFYIPLSWLILRFLSWFRIWKFISPRYKTLMVWSGWIFFAFHSCLVSFSIKVCLSIQALLFFKMVEVVQLEFRISLSDLRISHWYSFISDLRFDSFRFRSPSNKIWILV